MNTIGRDRWPSWVKQVVGKKKKNIEIKEQNGRYYAYKYTSTWDKKRKGPTKTSAYLGVVKKRTGIQAPYEAAMRGIYEYGHVRFVWNLLEKNRVLRPLKHIFPDDWKVLLVFAMNRLIDPRPIKSMKWWYEKTYLVKRLEASISPKTISRVLETVGLSWNSQREFFEAIRRDGEKILYDGSVIFSSSKDNPLLETGYNKEHLLLTKANLVLAFSHDRFFPIFFRVIPGSVHEITTLDILLEELGNDVVLVMDKGFSSADVRKKKPFTKKVAFIVPLKRNSTMINYDAKLGSFFMYRERPIKYTCYQHGKFLIYLYEDLALKIEEEKTYFTLLSKGKKVEFREEWAGKIAIISNRSFAPEEAYEMWKSRDQIEKSFDILQNMLDTDRPHVRKEETFRGYLFASFIGLIAYYLILTKLKKAKLSTKVSVADVLLELSKIYKIDIGKKEVLSERSKRVRKLMETLNIENLITKSRWS